MAGFSVFHFIIVAVIVLLIAAPMAYFGIIRERSSRRIRRGPYALTFVGLMVGVLVLGGVLGAADPQTSGTALSLIGLGVEFYLLRLTVRRLRDIGWSRNWAYPCLIPYIGLLAYLTFCFIPSGASDAAEIVEAF
ncbi:MAG TPA: DUF805 domain-containing protein [Candidatus Nitrosotalea sp.]|nr:DUF805 domain-containing protein [Candidatus Nitrosotalea sp.]